MLALEEENEEYDPWNLIFDKRILQLVNLKKSLQWAFNLYIISI